MRFFLNPNSFKHLKIVALSFLKVFFSFLSKSFESKGGIVISLYVQFVAQLCGQTFGPSRIHTEESADRDGNQDVHPG